MFRFPAGVRARMRCIVGLSLSAAFIAYVPLSEPASADDAQTSPQGPVELEQLTTETSQVMQLPDGTMELTSYREPVRVEQNGEWVDVDPTVERQPDGTVAPKATASDIEFSPGGGGPLVTMTAGGHHVELTWEDPLPEPIIAADTVTYPAVRAGVDLVLQSTPTGYTKNLVIRDASAAAQLIAQPAKMTLTGEGLNFTTDSDGHVTASDANGVVFTSAPPVLWDSSAAGATANAPTSSDPGDGVIRLADADVNAANGRIDLSVAPPSEVLTDASTEYPLFLDPAIDRNKYHYLTVHSRGWDYYDDSAQPMRVGYCGWSECNTAIQGTGRSFFSFDLSALTVSGVDPIVYDATVYATQTHNATSGAQPVNLTKATAFSKSTNWPGPIGGTLQTVSSAAGYGSNDAAKLAFSADAVRAYVQAAANAEDSKVQFSLSAPDSGDRNQWKKFNNNPSITVKFGYPPTTPTDLDIAGGVKCPGKPVYTTDTTPTLYARSDERSTANLQLLYYFDVYSGRTIVSQNTAGVGGASNALVSWQTAPALGEGVFAYRVQSKVNDSRTVDTASALSPSFVFTVDTLAPPRPTVTSFSYPPDYWGAAENSSGRFDLVSSSDTAGFAWAIDTDAPASVSSTICNYNAALGNTSGLVPASAGKGAVTLPAGRLSEGPHTLTVRAFDGAHNMSPVSERYVFQVSPSVTGSLGTNIIEAESMQIAQRADEAEMSTFNASGAGWSGGAASMVIADHGSESQPSSVNYHFRVPTDAYYALGARVATGPHFGKVRFAVSEAEDADGDSRMPLLQPDGSGPLVVDTYSPVDGSRFVPLGEYLPQEGLRLQPGIDYVLSADIVGTSGQDFVYTGMFGDKTLENVHDNGHSFGLDYLTVAPLKHSEFASLSDAFDNQAIGSTTASKFSLSSSDTTSLSRAAMDEAGIVAGQTATVGGVPFAIPAPNQSKDNVITQGQTITMPAATKGRNVYLLATANCGPLSPAARRQLSIGYSVEVQDGVFENATSDSPLMQIPDWLSAPPADSSAIPGHITLSHYLDGSTAVTAATPTLYVLRFPVAPDYTDETITNVTLPRVGTTYTTAGCGAAGTQSLRVFAMTVQ